MEIVLGQALNGTDLQATSDSLGRIVCGLLRLVDVLETQLGLKRKPVSDMTRTFQLVKVLEKLVKNNQPFYSASFEKDPLAVSETLLGWRDSLGLAGWNGKTNGNSRRLRDLADANAALKNAIPPGQSHHACRRMRQQCAENRSLRGGRTCFPLRPILRKNHTKTWMNIKNTYERVISYRYTAIRLNG
jgi:hypothetical protein